MNEKEFLELFAEAIDREAEVKMEDEFRNYDEWSSIAYLCVISMMLEKCDAELDNETFKKTVTVRDLYDLVKK